jgi:pimeloyl-ACP methyl ester carboxylesterase
VPPGYLEFVDEMLSATPFEVVADFFASFGDLDKFDCIETFGRVPTSIICGTADKLTSIGHSRKLHERVPGSRLLECQNAGHMVIMERHDQVNAELDQLITAATSRAAAR